MMRTHILSTFLYACGSWTLTAALERRIQALWMKCFRRTFLTKTMWRTRIRSRIQNAIRVHDDLLTMVQKQKRRWYSDNSARDSERSKKERKTEDEMGRYHQGRDWNGDWRFPEGSGGQENVERYWCNAVVPRRPLRLRDWDELRW